MGLPKKLTEMQIKFAQLLVTNEGRKTPTECAIEAGYNKDRATITASELQSPRKYPLVVKYIGEIRDEYNKKYEVDYGKHIAELGKIRQQALSKGAWSAAVNAEVARGKAAGFQNNNHLHLHKDLDNMEESELDKMLEKALKTYKPIINADAEIVEEVKD